MLFTEMQLQPNGLHILDEATYLTEQEAIIRPQTVPVMEASNLGAYRIPFYALESLAESHGYSLLDAISEVCIADQIDPAYVVIEMAEEEAILYPEVVQELGSVVIAPISEYDPIYQLCEAVVEEYADSLDDALLESLFNSDMSNSSVLKAMKQAKNDIENRHRSELLRTQSPSEMDRIRINAKYQKELQDVSREANDAIKRRNDKQQAQFQQQQTSQSNNSNNSILGSLTLNNQNKKNPNRGAADPFGYVIDKLAKAIGVGALGTTAAIGGGILAYKHYKNKPKSVIAKKIASLRKLYSKIMHRFQSAPNDGIKNKLKHVAGKILQVIDKLLALLQRKADGK